MHSSRGSNGNQRIRHIHIHSRSTDENVSMIRRELAEFSGYMHITSSTEPGGVLMIKREPVEFHLKESEKIKFGDIETKDWDPELKVQRLRAVLKRFHLESLIFR